MALGVAGWMASGQFNSPASEAKPDAVAPVEADKGVSEIDAMPKVSAVTVENSAVRRSVRASGVTQPKSIVTVSTEISGTVRKVPPSEGAAIARGDVLLSLNTDTLPVRIEAAKAEIAAAQTAYDLSLIHI